MNARRPAAALPVLTLPWLTACTETPVADSTDERAGHFECDDGETLSLRFRPSLSLLERSGETFGLARQPAGSGLPYGNARMALRGKGQEARLEIGRRAPVTCTVR